MGPFLYLSMARVAGFACVLAMFHCIQVHQAFAQAPKARAFPANERIRIDGKLDEPAWKSATPIGDLIEVLPKEGNQPSEKTEVRVLVDSDALYFGITCFDRTPPPSFPLSLHATPIWKWMIIFRLCWTPSSITGMDSFSQSIPQERARMDKFPIALNLQTWIGMESGTLTPA